MLLNSVALAAGGLAAATNAFLVPPEIAETGSDAANAPHFQVFPIVDSKIIDVSCPGCSHTPKGALGDGELSPETQEPTHLELAFEIQHEVLSDRLVVNGYELYPDSNPFTSTLTAPHLADSQTGAGLVEPTTAELGFSMEMHTEVRDRESLLELISFDLQIFEVGTSFVDGIPNVQVKLIKVPGGGLMISSVETTESQTLPPSAPMDKEQDDCTTFVCKWAAIMEEQLEHVKKPFKSCGGRKKAHGEGGLHPHRVHHMSGHRKHHRHGIHRSWGQLLKRIASHILLPVLVGIIAGVSVSV